MSHADILHQYLRQSENGTVMIDPILTEAAIKLVQKSGYTVFKNAAQYQAHATHSVETYKYASYSRGPDGYADNFLNYIKKDMAIKLGVELLNRGIAEFTQPPPTLDGSDPYMSPTRTQFMLSIKGFFSKDKEFERVL